MIRRRNNQAAAKVLAAFLSIKRMPRGLEEGIQVGLLDARLGVIELALDGGPRAVIHAVSYQVNAGIRLTTVVAPIRPAADLIELVLQGRVGLKIVDHQLLKGNAVFSLWLVFTQLF